MGALDRAGEPANLLAAPAPTGSGSPALVLESKSKD